MKEETKENYEIGVEIMEELIEEHGLVKGVYKYYKGVITGDLE